MIQHLIPFWRTKITSDASDNSIFTNSDEDWYDDFDDKVSLTGVLEDEDDEGIEDEGIEEDIDADEDWLDVDTGFTAVSEDDLEDDEMYEGDVDIPSLVSSIKDAMNHNTKADESHTCASLTKNSMQDRIIVLLIWQVQSYF